MSNLITAVCVKDTPNYIEVGGYLTHITCMDFIHKINEHLNSFVDPVILNLNKLRGLDGSGVGVLVTLAICLKHQRKEMIIIMQKDEQPYLMLKELKLTKLLGVQ